MKFMKEYRGAMEAYPGSTGLEYSWREEAFPNIIKCDKCGGEAKVMFVAAEKEHCSVLDYMDNTGNFICQLHSGDNWVKDGCAVAVYFCTQCHEPQALLNQAQERPFRHYAHKSENI